MPSGLINGEDGEGNKGGCAVRIEVVMIGGASAAT
jgi:hypothetical protein